MLGGTSKFFYGSFSKLQATKTLCDRLFDNSYISSSTNITKIIIIELNFEQKRPSLNIF
jgi:hypothetical protein